MKKRLIEVVGNLLAVLLICLSVAAQHQTKKDDSEIQPLAFGEIINAEISPMQKHRFQVKLEANQFVKFEVAEKNCDVVISFRSPDGVNLLEFKNIEPVNGAKTVEAAVSESGDYELRIMSFGETEGTGSYSVKIAELRTAAEKELNFTGGVKIFNQSFNGVIPTLSTIESLRKSIQNGQIALEKFRLAGATQNEARTLWQIGVVYYKLGDTSKSIEFYQAAVEKYRIVSDKKGEVYALIAIGDAYSLIGDTEKAIRIFSETLKISREVKLEMTERDSLNKLGDIYMDFGDYERAEIYFNQSAEIVYQYKNVSLSFPLINFGKIAFYKGEYEKALEYFQKSLETVRKEEHRLGTKKESEASFLNNIGRTQYALGKREKAVEAFNESLSISRQYANYDAQAATFKYLGKIYLENGDVEKSLEFFNQSLEIYRNIEDTQNVAESLLLTAKTNLKKGDLNAAQTMTEQALKLVETVRGKVKTAELRDSYSENLQDYYGFYIEVLMRKNAVEPNKNYAALAFEANEKRKARGLLNLLTESNANIREGVDPKLLEKEAELRNLLSARLENLTRTLGKKSKPEDIETLKREIEEVRAEYEQTQAQIRSASPRYAALTQPRTLTLAEVQNNVLDNGSVLLEYFLGAEKSYLWLVSKNDFQTIELPEREAIEINARQVYEALTARNRQVKFETAEERRERLEFADSDFVTYSKVLSRTILAPAISSIGNKRLLIVADGALQYIPFSALKINEKYLIETNEIINLPSVSVLAVLREDFKGRPNPKKTLAVLADPVFEKNDERLAKVKTKPAFENVAIRKATRDGLELSRLPFTRREAQLVGSLVPANQQTQRLDFKANRQFVFSKELADYRYIHFATHGFINPQTAELSGIVLSLFDETGAEQDGFLRVGDIYNLKLNAEMVVLSGCQTGLGKEIKGEGLVGLTRGFMYAGARRVTVSLWDVNDEATSDLMGKFYREMLGTKKLAPASALRQAQISMIRNDKWKNPYYWASFTLQGEPK